MFVSDFEVNKAVGQFSASELKLPTILNCFVLR